MTRGRVVNRAGVSQTALNTDGTSCSNKKWRNFAIAPFFVRHTEVHWHARPLTRMVR